MLCLIAAVLCGDGVCRPSHAQTSFLAHCGFGESSRALGIQAVPFLCPPNPLAAPDEAMSGDGAGAMHRARCMGCSRKRGSGHD